MSGPLLLVDAPSVIYRAFYALPRSITGPDGKPVNALLGAVNLILFSVLADAPRARSSPPASARRRLDVGADRARGRRRP